MNNKIHYDYSMDAEETLDKTQYQFMIITEQLEKEGVAQPLKVICIKTFK